MNSDTPITGCRSQYQLQPDDEIAGEVVLSADIDVEVDDVTFHVSSHDCSALVSFKRLRDSYIISKKVRRLFASSGIQRANFEDNLQRLGITLFLQNHRFGVMGPKANRILRRIFNLAVFSN